MGHIHLLHQAMDHVFFLHRVGSVLLDEQLVGLCHNVITTYEHDAPRHCMRRTSNSSGERPFKSCLKSTSRLSAVDH